MRKKLDESQRRSYKIDIRFTPLEYEKIKSEMECNGYLSMSKYIRMKLLKGRLVINHQIVTDRDIKNQVNRLSTEISRIGANYNMTVKKYMAMCRAKKEDGSALINTRATNYYINNLYEMTTKVKELMDVVVATVSVKNNNNEDENI